MSCITAHVKMTARVKLILFQLQQLYSIQKHTTAAMDLWETKRDHCDLFPYTSWYISVFSHSLFIPTDHYSRRVRCGQEPPEFRRKQSH